jgi:hypothetical protein
MNLQGVIEQVCGGVTGSSWLTKVASLVRLICRNTIVYPVHTHPSEGRTPYGRKIMASSAFIGNLPIELIVNIERYLDDPSRLALRLTCKSFQHNLDPFVVNKLQYKQNQCYRRLIDSHTNSDLELQCCRICNQRWPRDTMFTSTLLSSSEQEQIDKDFIFRHKCGRDGGPGMISTNYSDICDAHRHLFVHMVSLRPRDTPAPAKTQWILDARFLCMHCQTTKNRMHDVCGCGCSLCGTRPVQVFLRLSWSTRPHRYAVFRENGVYRAAEWWPDGTRHISAVSGQT